MKIPYLKQLALLILILGLRNSLIAQNVCNPNGNLMLYTNYDGGVLNINVDQNIPNLIIGVVGYEATSINLSGAFVNNVIAVHYAGYNGTNNPCGNVLATSINGAPGPAATSTVFAPAATINNPNGYGMIICGYSCSNNSNQGGCNTVDQIEAYFLTLFPNSTLYAHMVQYNCWSGTYSVSAGGSCCPTSPFLQGSVVGNQTVCAGSTITPLTSSVAASGGTGAIVYQWEASTTSTNAGFSPILSATAASYSPFPLMNTTYFRRGASTSSNSAIYSNVITVSVVTMGTLSVSGNTGVCLPAVVTLSASAQGATNYSWTSTFGSPFIQNPVIVVPVAFPGPIMFTCTATNAFGCSSTTTLMVQGLSTPTVTTTGATVCFGESATLTANGLLAYQWTGPSGYSSSAQNAFIPSATNVQAGTYTVIGQAANECVGWATAVLNTLPLPIPAAMSTGTICAGQTGSITAYGANNYTLFPGNSMFSSVVPVSPNATTAYTVQGSDSNGCIGAVSVTLQVSICTAIGEKQIDKEFISLYPNPTTGNFYIEANQETILEVFNSIGQKILYLELNEKNNYKMLVQSFSSGVYYVLDAKTEQSIKLVVVN